MSKVSLERTCSFRDGFRNERWVGIILGFCFFFQWEGGGGHIMIAMVRNSAV